MKNKKFKKGELTEESFKVLMFDLGCLDLKNTTDNQYHYNLLLRNIQDIFGIEIGDII